MSRGDPLKLYRKIPRPVNASRAPMTRHGLDPLFTLIIERLKREPAIAHDDATIDLDGAAGWDDIDVNLLILQQVAAQLCQAGERADGKFARAVAVGGGEEVIVQFPRQFLVLAADIRDIAAPDGNGNRLLQHAIFVRKVVAEDITD